MSPEIRHGKDDVHAFENSRQILSVTGVGFDHGAPLFGQLLSVGLGWVARNGVDVVWSC